ncbi:MAG: glutathione S-transferase family protein [Myxococcota bacterium]
MAQIRLYTQKLNPYAEKVSLALNFKGLPYERIESDDPEDRKRWSPVSGLLPVLEIAGERVHESAKILRWLETRFPEPPLLSKDPKTAAAQQRFAEWSDTSFVWYWNRWRTARFPRPGDERPPEDGLLAKVRRGVRRGLGRPRARPSRVELREFEVAEELVKRLDDLVGMLGERAYFLADEPSVADLSVFGMLNVIGNGPILEGRDAIEARPRLSAYMERMEEITRPR